MSWAQPLKIDPALAKKPVSEAKVVVKPPVEMSLSDLITKEEVEEEKNAGFLNYTKFEDDTTVSALSFDNERILVLDAGAFINYMKIEKHGSKFITTPQVLNEIKDSRSRHILQTLPFDLNVREPTSDDIKMVTRYAKKTGDYANLSATDIGIIALTLMIEKEMNGTKNLKPEPKALNIAAGIKCSTPMPYSELRDKMEGKEKTAEPAKENQQEEETNEEEDSEEEDFDEDEGEWITPENIKEYKEKTNNMNKDTSWYVTSSSSSEQQPVAASTTAPTTEETLTLEEEETESVAESNISTSASTTEKAGSIKYVGRIVSTQTGVEHKVGCVTSDFSVQHVLAHMGLNLVSVDGFRIKYLSQWVKRCTCCYTIVPDVERKWCPNCGNDTLKRITCVMDEDGTLNFYFNPKAKFSLRGTIYTNPIPKGGKYNNDPVFREDQMFGYKSNTNKKSAKLLNAKSGDDFDMGTSSRNAFNKRRHPNQIKRRK